MVRMVVETRMDPRMESGPDLASPLTRGRAGRIGADSKRHGGAQKRGHASAARRATSKQRTEYGAPQWSSRVYWKDIASAEARDELRAHNKHHQVLEVTSSRSSSLGLQELVHGDGGLAVEQIASAAAAPQERALLSTLVESKLLEHAQKKLDATIQAEWEVVDTRTVDEEEYVML